MRDWWLVAELLAWYLLIGISVVNTWVVMMRLLVMCVPAFWTSRFMAYRRAVRQTLAERQEKLRAGAAFKGDSQ